MISGEMIVEHVHYKPWDSDKLPQDQECVDDLIELIQKDGAHFLRNEQVKRSNDEFSDKLLVMSGQDSGRTGTFMALVNAITILEETKYEAEREVSVFSIVRRLREQRFEMVSNLEQYAFIHKMLKEYMSPYDG